MIRDTYITFPVESSKIGNVWYKWRGRWLKLLSSTFPPQDPIPLWSGTEPPEGEPMPSGKDHPGHEPRKGKKGK